MKQREHTIPQCVLWSCLGLACLPVRAKGVLQRRKCDNDDAYVRRFSTWLTPALPPAIPLSPQLPVARLYFNPSVMWLLLIAAPILKCFPSSRHRWRCFRTSLVSLRNNMRNKPPSNGPAKSNLFLPKWSRSSSSARPNLQLNNLWTAYPIKKPFFVSQFSSVPTWGNTSFWRIDCA